MPLPESELAEPGTRHDSSGSPGSHFQATLDLVRDGVAMSDGCLIAWNRQFLELRKLREAVRSFEAGRPAFDDGTAIFIEVSNPSSA